MISTPGDLIDKLGGTGAVAALFDVQDNTVSTWRARGFPAWARHHLREASARAALAVDPALFEATRPRARSAA